VPSHLANHQRYWWWISRGVNGQCACWAVNPLQRLFDRHPGSKPRERSLAGRDQCSVAEAGFQAVPGLAINDGDLPGLWAQALTQ